MGAERSLERKQSYSIDGCAAAGQFTRSGIQARSSRTQPAPHALGKHSAAAAPYLGAPASKKALVSSHAHVVPDLPIGSSVNSRGAK